jgi:hypothetical protein
VVVCVCLLAGYDDAVENYLFICDADDIANFASSFDKSVKGFALVA